MSGGGVVGERGVELCAGQDTSYPQPSAGNNTPLDLSGGGVCAGGGGGGGGGGGKGGATAAWAEVSDVSTEKSGEAGYDYGERRKDIIASHPWLVEASNREVHQPHFEEDDSAEKAASAAVSDSSSVLEEMRRTLASSKQVRREAKKLRESPVIPEPGVALTGPHSPASTEERSQSQPGCEDKNSRRLNNSNSNNNNNNNNSSFLCISPALLLAAERERASCNDDDDDDGKLSRKSAGSAGGRAEPSFDGKLVDDIVCVEKKNPRSSIASIREGQARTMFTSTQRAFLEKSFALNNYPSTIDKEDFASHLKLTQKIVNVWFQNRRNLEKRKRQDSISPLALTELKRVFANNRYPSRNTKEWLARNTGLSVFVITEWFADRRGKWRTMENEELCKMMKTLADRQVMKQYREEISLKHDEWAKNVLMMARLNIQKAKIQTGCTYSPYWNLPHQHNR